MNEQETISRNELAELLRISPEAFSEFEAMYKRDVLTVHDGSIYDISAKDAVASSNGELSQEAIDIIKRVVKELVAQTTIYEYKDGKSETMVFPALSDGAEITSDEVMALPTEMRPQLTGSLAKIDVDSNASSVVMMMYKQYMESEDLQQAIRAYHVFRQGLDLLDVDWVLYEVIGTNQNSMGYWLPKLVDAVVKQGFFKIPNTIVAKIPLTLLQMTRLDYSTLSASTMEIVNRYCQEVFKLRNDTPAGYFLKTGTYSSKFDFRNAHVWEPMEIKEIGQYLLYIHNQAIQMASPLNKPCIYGVSTTNEWVVREFIPDKEGLGTIYKGLPLRPEFRVFIDTEKQLVLSVVPYWSPDVMKERFLNHSDADSPHQKHDYVIYKASEDRLMSRYHNNLEKVTKGVQKLICDCGLSLPGQWSMDIMLNGDDFWIIDMGRADTSAYNESIPETLRRTMQEDWIPKLEEKIDVNI